MNLPALAIEKRAITYFATLLLTAGGIYSFFQLGQLEDPEFSVKTAAITTLYPGASAGQVEEEVTDRIEAKLQEMSQVKDIYSVSRPGLSIIKVDIKPQYWSDRLPQVWDEMRKKVRDIEAQLPPGAGQPQVGDDFGYVFGFLMAITAAGRDGYKYADLESYAKQLRKELSVVSGVARIDFWGVQQKRIFIDVSQAQLAELGLTPADLKRTLQVQNKVVDAGSVDHQDQRLRIAVTGEFTTLQEIGELAVTGTSPESLLEGKRPDEIIRIRDFATVGRGYLTTPVNLMRYNGQPAIGMALAPLSGENVVEVGRRVDQRLAELMAELPVGIEVEKISWQSDMVDESIRAFLVNLAEAVGIVLLVLALTMGIRSGFIIGVSGLVLAILGTFIVMLLMGIDLQRVSLGALIIAMGMMVDNAIVVADGIAVRIAQGMDRKKAAIEAAGLPAWPLLGATVVACMAFFPIYSSPEDTGEYAGSMFTVVAISLLFSWLLSQTVAPLMCMAMLPGPKPGGPAADPYGGRFYGAFRRLLTKAIRYRVLFLGGLVGLLVLSGVGFRFVPQMFFPDSSRVQVMIDYWVPEGTRIQQTSADLVPIEDELMANPAVQSVSSFVGQGPPRFYLPVSPEDPYSSYAQLIVNVKTLPDVDKLIEQITPWLRENVPQAHIVRVRKYAVGSFTDWPIEARFIGPPGADPQVLRDLAARAMDVLQQSPIAKEVRTNWRQRVRRLSAQYNQERGRWSGVSRDDVAGATKRAQDGLTVGQYREGDDLIPILLRATEDERDTAAVDLERLQVAPAFSHQSVPVSQVVQHVDVPWEDQNIWRWNRRRAITVQCAPRDATAVELRNSVKEEIEAIKPPPGYTGYTMEWRGEHYNASKSQKALVPGLVPTVVIMVLVIVVLFNAYRPPLIIFLVIPFVLIGISLGLLITQVPFGFIALLGAMSLSGMMIKNAVVLLDQINLNLSDGMTQHRAVVEAAVSRLRPVLNAAATTVLGMAPLLQDVFWISLAVTIMFGLAFGTVLTMVVVPALYALFYRVSAEVKGE